MTIDVEQFSRYIVRPALKYIDLYSFNAEQQVTGTALTESKLEYVKQMGNGPALGFFQMEPATCNDILKNFVAYKPDLKRKLMDLAGNVPKVEGSHILQYNLLFAAAMCRIHYFRKREPLPQEDDLHGMARYWKKHYNTHLGKGKVEHFIIAAKPILTLKR